MTVMSNLRVMIERLVELEQEVIQLKEQNREMVEALKVAEDALVHNYNNVAALQSIVPLLAKAEREG